MLQNMTQGASYAWPVGRSQVSFSLDVEKFRCELNRKKNHSDAISNLYSASYKYVK